MQQPSIRNGQLIVAATVGGTATVAGATATIRTQTITLTATATCSAGTGALTLTTTAITADLSNGTRAQVAPVKVTANATCGRGPTLGVTLAPASVTVSDGTSVSASQCSITASAPSSTTIGSTICQVHDLICSLATAIADGSAGTAVSELISTLQKPSAWARPANSTQLLEGLEPSSPRRGTKNLHRPASLLGGTASSRLSSRDSVERLGPRSL